MRWATHEHRYAYGNDLPRPRACLICGEPEPLLPDGHADPRPASARYMAALTELASGIAADAADGSGETEPQQLRLSLLATQSDKASLVRLLIAKGLISFDEYEEACVMGMESTARSYRVRLGPEYGV